MIKGSRNKKERKSRIKNKNSKTTRIWRIIGENGQKLRYCHFVLQKTRQWPSRDNVSCAVPRKTLSLGYLAGGANRFLAASPTAGGVDGGMAYGGVRGGGRLSEAHFVGGRYGAARRHPQRPGRLLQPHIR